MVKKLFAVMLFLLLIMPLIFAATVTTTSLTINTKPNHELLIKATNAANGNKVQEITKNSGDSGTVQATIYSIGIKEINIEISISKDFVEIKRENFGPYAVTTPVTIDISLDETKAEESEKTAIAEKETSGITGKVTEESEGGLKNLFSNLVSNKVVWYILIALVAGGGIFFGVRFFMTRQVIPQNIVVKKQSELLKEHEAKKEKEKEDNNYLKRLDDRLQEIQTEISKIKNRDKIIAAERKLKEDVELLEKLRKGEDI